MLQRTRKAQSGSKAIRRRCGPWRSSSTRPSTAQVGIERTAHLENRSQSERAYTIVDNPVYVMRRNPKASRLGTIAKMPKVSGMTISVLVHPKCKSLASIGEAINTVNQLQPYFRLQVSRAKWLPNYTKEEVARGATKKLIRKRYARRPVLTVIQNPIRGGWFDYQSRDVWIVSTAHWEEHFAPPPLKVYLIYEFACALAAFVADLHNEQIDAMSHNKKLRGCVFDQTSGRRELLLGLVAAHLCARCEGRLSEMGVSDKAIEAIFSILAFVRDFAIRRPRSTRSLVFVGHGRSDDWKSLDPFLTIRSEH